MTKKQIAALKRIVDRENFRNNKDKRPGDDGYIPGGVHPSSAGYVVTDGYIAVLFSEKPDGISEADRLEHIGKIVTDERENGNHALIEEKFPLDDWKKFARQEEKLGNQPRVTIGGNTDFNPRLVVDAMEAIGTGAMVYLGCTSKRTSYNTLLVYPKDWMDNPDNCPVAFVLPLRRKA